MVLRCQPVSLMHTGVGESAMYQYWLDDSDNGVINESYAPYWELSGLSQAFDGIFVG